METVGLYGNVILEEKEASYGPKSPTKVCEATLCGIF